MNAVNKVAIGALTVIANIAAMETVPLHTATARTATQNDRKDIINLIRETGAYAELLQTPENLVDAHLCKKKHDTFLGWALEGQLVAVNQENRICAVLLYSINQEKLFCLNLGTYTTISLLVTSKEHDTNEYYAALLKTLQQESEEKLATKIQCLHPDEKTLTILQANGFNIDDDFFAEKIIVPTA